LLDKDFFAEITLSFKNTRDIERKPWKCALLKSSQVHEKQHENIWIRPMDRSKKGKNQENEET
jgi:hypothetical protein